MNDLLESSAKIEYTRSLNGKETNTKVAGIPYQKYRQGNLYVNKIDPETGEKTRVDVEVSERTLVSPYAYKYTLGLDEKPVFFNEIKNLDPNIRITKGLYMIKYIPKTNSEHKKGRPWKIGQDLVRWDVRVAGRKHWHKLCDLIPEFKWLERNSTLTDNLFSLSAKHPGMSFWFTIKWDEYEAKLNAQQHTKKPFVSYKCSVDDYNNIYKDKTATIRYFNDILKEINEAERDPEVVAEMEAESGEVYVRGRATERDPVTGQFLKQKHKQEEE